VRAELPHAGRRKTDMSQLRVVFAFLSEKSKNPRVILGMDLKLLVTDLNLNLCDNRRCVCASVIFVTYRKIKTVGFKTLLVILE
jgi:hypothetical protein